MSRQPTADSRQPEKASPHAGAPLRVARARVVSSGCRVSAVGCRPSRGFTLLEVMVAIAILGLSLSVILSAQGGLSASNRAAANMGNAVQFGRCKMTEIEEQLLKLGYPQVDDLQTDVACCSDERTSSLTDDFRCDTRVEKVELPAAPGSNGGADGGLSLGGSLAGAIGSAAGSTGAAGSAGGLPNLPGLINNPAGGAGLDLDGGLQSLGQNLSSQFGGQGAAGLLNLVLGLVYPSMKPMMEVSIRKVTVTVRWKEGAIDRSLDLVQYVTNPQQGGFLAGAIPGVDPNAPPGTAPTGGATTPGAPGAATPGGGLSPSLGAGGGRK